MNKAIHEHRQAPPSRWVQQHVELIPTDGPVLDLACGSGRHTRLLLDLGHSVVAADQNLSQLSSIKNSMRLELLQVDLETEDWPFSRGQFAGIVVTNYLYRPRLAQLALLLKPAGVLVYETFAAGNEQYGRPRNPDYLLKQDELIEVFTPSLEVVAYEQVTEMQPNPAVKQRICARQTTPGS